MRSATVSARHHPYRVNREHRFPNSVQRKQQASTLPPGIERDSTQAAFTQQVPFRPTRGVDSPRGYAFSRDQPVQSIEKGSHAPAGLSRSSESRRRIQSRRSTPRRYAPHEKGTVNPPLAPIATQAYLKQAHLEPKKLKEPKRLLVILDLNGTLMLKLDFRNPKDIRIRPGAPQLLEYLFKNHNVMVYTSAQPHNAERVASMLFSEQQYDLLVGIWARDKLDLTPAQYKEKVQVYKKLDKVWATNEIQASFFPPGQGRWDQTNTILVDDSHLKALQEPHNLLQIPEFTNERGPLKKKVYEKKEEQICQSLVVKLETLKWQDDVSRLIFRWQTGRADMLRVPGSKVFVGEKVDQQEQAARDLEAARNLPTPESPVTTDDESDGDAGVALPTETLNTKVLSVREESQSPIGEEILEELLKGGDDAKDMPTSTSQGA